MDKTETKDNNRLDCKYWNITHVEQTGRQFKKTNKKHGISYILEENNSFL